MPLIADVLQRKETDFVLWSPKAASPPGLLIAQLKPGNPPSIFNNQAFMLAAVPGIAGLWTLSAANCGLQDGQVYHYWFIVEDTRSGAVPPPRIAVTDPLAYAVDWRVSAPDAQDNTQPASVILYEGGRLVAADPGGEKADFTGEAALDTLAPNNRLVIYELPTAWATFKASNVLERDVGTFRDIIAMIDSAAGGANFGSLTILQPGHSYLTQLGINALELLPPADSFFKREWGYGTTHYLSADFELGFPTGYASPTAISDLAALSRTCHNHSIRLFADIVMAFGHEEPYQRIDHSDFYIDDPKSDPNDPDAMTSTRGNGTKGFRDGFGSTLFRYARFINTYDPISGAVKDLAPARQHMLTYLTRWMNAFHIDGIRMDSVENVANWDFIQEFKDHARGLWQERWNAAGLGAGADARFLVVGEELTLPMDLLRQQRLDGLWNDTFREFVRAAILGQNAPSEPSFEWTVRKLIDCRILGFADGAQAVNYITSHDVEGYRRERLYTMLRGLSPSERAKRIKLAFACLLTAVGIPMILAGEEFGDENDFFNEDGKVTQDGGKQIDPVNFSRLDGPTDTDAKREARDARRSILECVSRLIHFRTKSDALATNDTKFIYVDFSAGKRVVVWQRGSDDNLVVVVANFSDFGTPNPFAPNAQYVVPSFPALPAGKRWREITLDRPADQAGREPIFPWEAKVYSAE